MKARAGFVFLALSVQISFSVIVPRKADSCFKKSFLHDVCVNDFVKVCSSLKADGESTKEIKLQSLGYSYFSKCANKFVEYTRSNINVKDVHTNALKFGSYYMKVGRNIRTEGIRRRWFVNNYLPQHLLGQTLAPFILAEGEGNKQQGYDWIIQHTAHLYKYYKYRIVLRKMVRCHHYSMGNENFDGFQGLAHKLECLRFASTNILLWLQFIMILFSIVVYHILAWVVRSFFKRMCSFSL